MMSEARVVGVAYEAQRRHRHVNLGQHDLMRAIRLILGGCRIEVECLCLSLCLRLLIRLLGSHAYTIFVVRIRPQLPPHFNCNRNYFLRA